MLIIWRGEVNYWGRDMKHHAAADFNGCQPGPAEGFFRRSPLLMAIAPALIAALIAGGCGRRDSTAPDGSASMRFRVPLSSSASGRPVTDPIMTRDTADLSPAQTAAATSEPAEVAAIQPMDELQARIGAGPGYQPDLTPSSTGTTAATTTTAPAAKTETPLPRPTPEAIAAAEEAGRRLRLINAVVADVNGEIITREDLLRELRPRMVDWLQTMSENQFQLRVKEEMRDRLLQQVRQKLLAQDAEKRSTEEFDKRLDKRIQEERQKGIATAGGESAWRRKLAEEQLTEEGWLRDQRMRYLVMSLVATEFAPRISVTRQELVDYYERLRADQYTLTDKARPQIIKLSLKDYPNMAAMLAAARSIISRSRGGEDFAKLTAEFAQAGSTEWGFVARDSFREKAVNEALFSLPVGSVSDAIATEDSVYIVRVAERVDGRVVPFTEVQDEIEQAVRRLKLDLMVNEHLNRLQERSYIRIYEENL